MVRPLLGVVLLVFGVFGGAAAPVSEPAPAPDQDTVVIRLPLQHGQLDVRVLLESICREVGIEPGPDFSKLDWRIDVGSRLGRLQLSFFDHVVPGAMTTEIRPGEVVVTIDRDAVAQRGQAVLDDIQGWLDEAFTADPDAERFGLFVASRDVALAPLEAIPPGTTRAVVLIHGLDDPGWLWRDLIPALEGEGHVILRFEYPDDQPIADSGDLLATGLRALRRAGLDTVSIVAHSMGGLISRDVLTRPAYYAGDGGGGEQYPAVARLIMLGTPNHGSAMARLRGISELGEVLSRWISGRRSWGDSLTDGAGEAGRDLLPDSDFLRRLNHRPHPSPTVYTIVAGRVSPVSPEEVDALIKRLDRITGAGTDNGDRVSSMLQSMVRGVGDGVVSIESARLNGIADVVTVEADHLSMIVNVFPSQRTPPAIPIVLERLRDG